MEAASMEERIWEVCRLKARNVRTRRGRGKTR